MLSNGTFGGLQFLTNTYQAGNGTYTDDYGYVFSNTPSWFSRTQTTNECFYTRGITATLSNHSMMVEDAINGTVTSNFDIARLVIDNGSNDSKGILVLPARVNHASGTSYTWCNFGIPNTNFSPSNTVSIMYQLGSISGSTVDCFSTATSIDYSNQIHVPRNQRTNISSSRLHAAENHYCLTAKVNKVWI